MLLFTVLHYNIKSRERSLAALSIASPLRKKTPRNGRINGPKVHLNRFFCVPSIVQAQSNGVTCSSHTAGQYKVGRGVYREEEAFVGTTFGLSFMLLYINVF